MKPTIAWEGVLPVRGVGGLDLEFDPNRKLAPGDLDFIRGRIVYAGGRVIVEEGDFDAMGAIRWNTAKKGPVTIAILTAAVRSRMIAQ